MFIRVKFFYKCFKSFCIIGQSALNSRPIKIKASLSFSLNFFFLNYLVFLEPLKNLNLSFKALFHKILKKLSAEPNFCVGHAK